MRVALVLLGTLVLGPAAMAECPATLEGLRASLDAADTSYDKFDFEAFSATAATIAADVACLSEPATPQDAARIHLVRALDSWVRRDVLGESALPRVELSLKGLMAADPVYAPQDDLMPEGSQLRAVYDAAKSMGPGESQPLVGDSWLVDGGAVEGLPTERAALVQYSGVEGVESWYLEGAAVPGSLRELVRMTARIPGEGRAGAQESEPSSESPRTSRALLIAGLAAGALAGGGLGAAAWAGDQYYEEPDREDAEGLYALNRAAGISGYAAAAAAGGLVAGAVIVRKW